MTGTTFADLSSGERSTGFDLGYMGIGTVDGSTVRIKMLQIGDWNMDTTSSVTVPHGIADHKKIISVTGVIFKDDDAANPDDSYTLANYIVSVAVPTYNDVSIYLFNDTYIQLNRAASGFFDSADFDKTSYNRGNLMVHYID
jgi:hypothetical protein